MSLAKRLLPFLSWPMPDRQGLRHEALAGLSVGLMVIPQGVAYAALAGMPLVSGIYASLLPALVAALFSASTRLSVGPTALTCLLVGTSLSGWVEPGSARWVDLVVWLSLLTGLLQLVLGFLRFGWLVNLISAPVLLGFTQAAAVLIIVSQGPALLGFAVSAQTGLAGATVHAASTGFGLATVALLLLARRWWPDFPSVLVIVLGAAGLSAWTGFEATGGAVVGALPAGLPSLYLPHAIDWATLSRLVLPTLVITLVSFIETASSAKVDSEGMGRQWNPDQDLIGQGLGKMASGLCGSFPTSSSFSRSALNLYAGARSGWATVVSVLVVMLALLVLTPVLHHVPKAVLSAIVVAAVLGLIKPRAFARLWHVAPAEAGIAGFTFVITLVTAPQLYWGVLAGVLGALSLFLHHRLHPRIIEVGLHPDGSLRDRHLWNLPPLAAHLYGLRMDAELDFASANGLERNITEFLSSHPDTRHVCLFAQPINRIDATGVEMFVRLREHLLARDITLHLIGLKLPVERTLRLAQVLDESRGLRLYRSDAEALAVFSRIST